MHQLSDVMGSFSFWYDILSEFVLDIKCYWNCTSFGINKTFYRVGNDLWMSKFYNNSNVRYRFCWVLSDFNIEKNKIKRNWSQTDIR